MFLDMSLQIAKSKSGAVWVLFRKLIDLLSGINKQQIRYSILVNDFNSKLSKWYPSDNENKAGQDINTFTTIDWSTDTCYKLQTVMY